MHDDERKFVKKIIIACALAVAAAITFIVILTLPQLFNMM